MYRQEGDRVTQRSVTGEQYGRFLVDVFEDWVRRDVGTVYVQRFDVALANWYGAPPSLCVHSETCGRALALEYNGDVYSCDHFVEPRHLLGNIGQRHLLELVDSPEQQEFGRHKRDGLPRFCRACDVRFACHGGCPKDRFDVTPDGEPGLNHLCPGFKEFFHHVDLPMRTMAAPHPRRVMWPVVGGRSVKQVRPWHRRGSTAADTWRQPWTTPWQAWTTPS